MIFDDVYNIKVGDIDVDSVYYQGELIWPQIPPGCNPYTIPAETDYTYTRPNLTRCEINAINVRAISFYDEIYDKNTDPSTGRKYNVYPNPQTPILKIQDNITEISIKANNIEYIALSDTTVNTPLKEIDNLVSFELAGKSKIKRFSFNGAESLEYVSRFNTELVTEMYSVFGYCKKLKTVPLFNTSNVIDMSYMFSSCHSLETVPLFDTSNVKNMAKMFQECLVIKQVPHFDTSNVITMNSMFSYCHKIETVPLFDTHNVTDTARMFQCCYNLQSVPLFDMSNVTNAARMFEDCDLITTVPLLNTSNVTNGWAMFIGCNSLITIPSLDFSNLIDSYGLFQNCQSLETLPLLNFQNAAYANMFSYCPKLKNVGGFTDLGKSLDHLGGSIDLSYSSLLTRESCLNIFNTIYDMNLNTNTIEGKGIYLHADVLANLSDEDIAIATNKGWTVSS